MDLYAVKPLLIRRLEPLLGWLERHRVSPDALTLAAIPIGAIEHSSSSSASSR